MNFETIERLTAQPARLSALLLNHADVDIDALVQEAQEDEGLFDGLSGSKLAEQKHLYRVRLFAEGLLDLVDEEDGTAAEFRERTANLDETCKAARIRLAKFWADGDKRSSPCPK